MKRKIRLKDGREGVKIKNAPLPGCIIVRIEGMPDNETEVVHEDEIEDGERS